MAFKIVFNAFRVVVQMPPPWGQILVTDPHLLPDLGWVRHDNDRHIIETHLVYKRLLIGYIICLIVLLGGCTEGAHVVQ